MDEREEIALGQQHDAEVRRAIGLYAEKPEAAAMVERVGAAIAAKSERPGLPWAFRVLDDPSVNAFALPGGYVYVTRGLLAHLNSEDELAAVLSHETGHVTARHAAVQLRKQQTALNTVGLFRIIDPNLRHVGGLAARTAGLALLKYSRDDENEADDLSLRYVQRTGYDPAAILEVFSVLSSIDRGQGRIPNWLSTHPQPDARRQRLAARIAQADPGVSAEYLSTIEGMVHGQDARDGFLLAQTYVHPRAGFRVDAPQQWSADYDGSGLVALSPDERALFVLGPSGHASAAEAIEAFFADSAVARGEAWQGRVGGVAMQSSAFAIGQGSDRVAGLVGFLDFDGRVLAMIAVGPEQGWAARAEEVARAFASFGRLTDRTLLEVDPMRIRVITVQSPTTLAELQTQQPSSVPIEELAILNHVAPDAQLPAGRPVKRVEGFNPRAETAAPPHSAPMNG
jgi:predicted Zn-dependent protease